MAIPFLEVRPAPQHEAHNRDRDSLGELDVRLAGRTVDREILTGECYNSFWSRNGKSYAEAFNGRKYRREIAE